MSDSHDPFEAGIPETITAAVQIDALALELHHEPVPAANAPSEGCTTGYVGLGGYAGAELGVWEMRRGVMHDTEAEELFVVVDGEATVEILAPAPARLELRPGTVVRLAAGMRTRWTVHSAALRKVVLVP